MSLLSKHLKVAVVQMRSTPSIAENLESIKNTLKTLSSQGSAVDLVSFPENCLFQRASPAQELLSFDLKEEFWTELESWAKTHQAHLHLGSIALRRSPEVISSGSKPFSNATIWISPGERAKVVYEKIHLFDIELKSGRKEMESKNFEAGQSRSIVDVKGWKIGLTICYDLRFSNLFELYARDGVDVIMVPASFLVETGRAHWEILLRARAIESQCYVLAAAQCGVVKSSSSGERATYGHSLIIDSWGKVLGSSQDEPGIQVVELDRGFIDETRSQMPMCKHRKMLI